MTRLLLGFGKHAQVIRAIWASFLKRDEGDVCRFLTLQHVSQYDRHAQREDNCRPDGQ
ncbi:hypothetical protein [Zavarzinella formosa]|uniref:hypothetical protein n=1 Tax=Zavarzinella formosa TaxID=360055 RepID=UPI0003667D20|nr:hypothetical protein [Zavarzinella formosa]